MKGEYFEPAHVKWKLCFRTLKIDGLPQRDRKWLRKQIKVFWGIAFQLILNSSVFRMALLGKSLGRKGRWFHRDVDIRKLFKIMKSYQAIVDSFKQWIPVRRRWLPYENEEGKIHKFRPLGIAPLSWRLYTKGLNIMLETFLANGWPNNQYAYKTGRGVQTAWRNVLSKVIKKKFIYEFDFYGFFNTVRHSAVGEILREFLVPKYVVIHLMNLCSSEIANVSVGDFLNDYSKSFPPGFNRIRSRDRRVWG
jgi:hypothetical protein